MRDVLIYLIAIGSSAATVAMWRLSRTLGGITGRLVMSFLRKQLIYTLVVRRQNGSSNVTVISAICMLVFVVGNAIASFVGIQTRIQLAERLAALFSINLVPLYLGGRSNFLVDRILGLPLHQIGLSHRWIGRVCATQGITHALLRMYLHPTDRPRISAVGAILLAVFSSLTVTSFLYLRRYMFELFLKTHFLFAFCLLVALWIHAKNSRRLHLVCLASATVIWSVQYLLWLGYLLYRNWGSGPATLTVVDSHHNTRAPVQALQLRIRPKRPWRVKSGQYVYLSIPAASPYGLLQMHPYYVAWTPDPFAPLSKEFLVLVQCKKGFSGDLRRCNGEVRTVIDGPYGESSDLKSYDTVLLLASGIGIAAYLLEVRSLLQAHEDQTSRIRRITLVWLLEYQEQEKWVHDIFRKLLEMDHRSILNIMLYVPPGSTAADIGYENLPRLFRIQDALDFSWLLNKEWAAEAGNMAISVCGPPSFEQAVRAALRLCKHDIVLHELDFQPDETKDSRDATSRFIVENRALTSKAS